MRKTLTVERHGQLWLWAASAFGLVAGGAAGIGGGLLASREDYGFWTGAPMIVASVAAVLALCCFVAAVAGLGFPFGSSKQHERQEPQAPRPLDSLRAKALAGLVAARDDLNAVSSTDLPAQLVPWWERHQEHFQGAARELYGPGMKAAGDIRTVTERFARDAAGNPNLAPAARQRLRDALDGAIQKLSG